MKAVIRGPVNNLDRATIVSILPREVVQVMHTVFPGKFVIPPGTYDNPSTLVVGPSSWWYDPSEESPLIEVPQSAIMMAESVINDYCKGLTEFRTEAQPGLFFVPGEVGISVIKKDYVAHLNRAKIRQKEWFLALTKLADALWARSNGNPMVVSSDMKIAAQELNMTQKEWLKNQVTAELIKCKACGSLNSSAVVICPTCKVIIDEVRAKELGLKFAS
jgi:hypothetical protein